jgi:hypothetical protein
MIGDTIENTGRLESYTAQPKVRRIAVALCRADSERIHAGTAGSARAAVPRAGDQRVPVR